MATVATASPYAAAGTYRGFTLQDVRLAFHLITVPPGCSVSIEHKDDVAIHFADGTVVHEQVKSAPKSEPLRDMAPAERPSKDPCHLWLRVRVPALTNKKSSSHYQGLLQTRVLPATCSSTMLPLRYRDSSSPR